MIGSKEISQTVEEATQTLHEINIRRFTEGNIVKNHQRLSALDLAIDGGGFNENKGFFCLSGIQNGTKEQFIYTRAGAFHINKDGNIVDENNRYLCCFLTDINNKITGAVGPLKIVNIIDPKATSFIDATFNLNASDTPPPMPFLTGFTPNNLPNANSYNTSAAVQIYDSLGQQHITTMYFVKAPAKNTWNMYVGIDGFDVTTLAGPFMMVFNQQGKFVDSGLMKITFDPTNANLQTINFDLHECTQFSMPFTISSLNQDGYPAAHCTGVEVNEFGVINMEFSNGIKCPLGQIMLAQFNDNTKLNPAPCNSWQETNGSGVALFGCPCTISFGKIISHALEDISHLGSSPFPFNESRIDPEPSRTLQFSNNTSNVRPYVIEDASNQAAPSTSVSSEESSKVVNKM